MDALTSIAEPKLERLSATELSPPGAVSGELVRFDPGEVRVEVIPGVSDPR
jgi:hypothetical protein